MKKVKHKSADPTGSASNRKAAYVVVLAIAIVAAGIVVFTNLADTARTVSAQSTNAQKRFKATRRIVVDKQTGQPRFPDEQEVEKLVADLQVLTQRSSEGLSESPVAGGVGEAINVDAGFGGTFVARPNADGTMETRCVFSFEEAAEFLGLVEDTL